MNLCIHECWTPLILLTFTNQTSGSLFSQYIIYIYIHTRLPCFDWIWKQACTSYASRYDIPVPTGAKRMSAWSKNVLLELHRPFPVELFFSDFETTRTNSGVGEASCFLPFPSKEDIFFWRKCTRSDQLAEGQWGSWQAIIDLTLFFF